jgi:hypothetical protein
VTAAGLPYLLALLLVIYLLAVDIARGLIRLSPKRQRSKRSEMET